METTTSLGYVVGFSVVAFVLLVLLFVALSGFVKVGKARNDDDTRFIGWCVVGSSGVAMLITAGAFIGAAWPPFDMPYHQYRPVTGTVENVAVRMMANGGSGTTQQYTVKLSDITGPVSEGSVYRCDDSRCSQIKPGDRITLMCIKVWEYAATDGYRCRWGKVEAG